MEQARIKDNGQKWKKSYSLVLLLNIVYIVVFWFLMQIYS